MAISQETTADFGTHLESWLEGFVVDRKVQNLARGTIAFYQVKLGIFITFCQAQGINRMEQITPDTLRRYILWLEGHGHNPGGIHACYRSLKTFLLWYEQEAEPEGWRNPVKRVKVPRLPIQPLAPINLEDFAKLVSACGDSPIGIRDKAILYALLDTGARKRTLRHGCSRLESGNGEYSYSAGRGPQASHCLSGPQE